MLKYFSNILLIAGIFILGLMPVGCDLSIVTSDLEALRNRGEIVVIMRNNATCYYEGPHGPTGFEYDLVKAFADHLGVKLRPVIIEDEAEMVTALRQGKADIIAAGLPFGRHSTRLLTLGPEYLEIQQQVVGRRGGPKVDGMEDLLEKSIWMAGNTARIETLTVLKKQHPGLRWHTLSDYSSEELLQMVWNQSLQLALVESNTLTMNRRFYPELVVRINLGAPQKLTWGLHPQNRHLRREVKRWFAMKTTHEIVQSLKDYYYSHLEEFDYVDLMRYRRRIVSRLPKYQPYFEEAADKYGLDWHLVAAQAYQESHWNPRARSFTGVRGIMMLTLDTAKSLGLKNRLAVKDAIFAGTRYLARLHKKVGSEVPEPDRTLMALAAYNLGFGHLKDARELARRLDKSADTWAGVRSVLPLLQQKKYYRTLPHGYARGNEAVQYVDRIRNYYKVLTMALVPRNFNNMGS